MQSPPSGLFRRSFHSIPFNARSALDTAHVTLSWHMIYYYLILNFDNPVALKDSVWCASFIPLRHFEHDTEYVPNMRALQEFRCTCASSSELEFCLR